MLSHWVKSRWRRMESGAGGTNNGLRHSIQMPFTCIAITCCLYTDVLFYHQCGPGWESEAG